MRLFGHSNSTLANELIATAAELQNDFSDETTHNPLGKMAETDKEAFNLEQLSPQQREALEQYTAVTAQDTKDAVPLLERSQWNVQIAISKFFDGEGPDLVQEAIDAENVPRAAARNENLQESLFASSHHPHRPLDPNRPTPAPRVVPQQPTVNRPGLLLGIILAPFSFGYKFMSTLYRTILYLLAFLPRAMQPRAVTNTMAGGLRSTSGRRMLMPRDTASRFKREFEEEYGEHELPFFDGGFAQAYDAAKRELKFLVMVLLSPEHDDNEAFTRDTLLAPDVVAFVRDPANNVILWGGNVLDSEAYQAAQDYNCTKFPFSAIICLTPREGSTKMGVIKRLVGPMPPATYLAELQTAINRYAPDLAGVRADRRAQEVARTLRDEQDSAYERSLARDRERAQRRREAERRAAEEERRALEEAEAKAKAEALRRSWRRWRATRLAPEPPAAAKDVVRVAIKMPEATGAGRIVRRFASDATMEELYAFVECYDELHGEDREDDSDADDDVDDDDVDMVGEVETLDYEYRFQLASLVPRKVFEPSKSVMMGEAIGRSGNLIVEDASHDSDDEE